MPTLIEYLNNPDLLPKEDKQEKMKLKVPKEFYDSVDADGVISHPDLGDVTISLSGDAFRVSKPGELAPIFERSLGDAIKTAKDYK